VDTLLGWGFVGTVVFVGCWCCHGHDGRAVLIGDQGHGALIQEGLPLVFLAGVLLVWHCSLVYATLASPVSVLTLNGGVGVTGVAPLQPQSFVGLLCTCPHSRVYPWW
jgi:hypothetical protein